ncbi:hypothetical protein [Alloprevotella tannerae]
MLYKDAKLCKEAAEDMKITSAELKNLRRERNEWGSKCASYGSAA